MDFEDWKELFLSVYEVEEIVDLLEIEAEELVCMFEDKLLSYYKEQLEEDLCYGIE